MNTYMVVCSACGTQQVPIRVPLRLLPRQFPPARPAFWSAGRTLVRTIPRYPGAALKITPPDHPLWIIPLLHPLLTWQVFLQIRVAVDHDDETSREKQISLVKTAYKQTGLGLTRLPLSLAVTNCVNDWWTN